MRHGRVSGILARARVFCCIMIHSHCMARSVQLYRGITGCSLSGSLLGRILNPKEGGGDL